ncbi:MAG: hypothetical protein H6Q72_1835 [Firmicutes bacterium]|nr:hypothetical protein [Bacillota bacterium]
MDYIYLGLGVIISFHALSYAYWLKNNGNLGGAVGVLVLVVTALALPILRMLKGN